MYIFFFKQKTAYEMRISDWSSDVCSSDLTIFVDPREIAEDDHVRLHAVARRTPGAEIDDIGGAVVGLTRQIFFRTEEEAAVAARQILLAEDIDRREDMAAIEFFAEARIGAIAFAPAMFGDRRKAARLEAVEVVAGQDVDHTRHGKIGRAHV